MQLLVRRIITNHDKAKEIAKKLTKVFLRGIPQNFALMNGTVIFFKRAKALGLERDS